jgi:hypothetical protein
MATIKRKQNGKIITKDGKVSCECCETICNESFLITDRNVFQITRQEYNQYVKGGIWSVSLSEAQSEIGKRTIPNRDASISGSVAYSTNASSVTINKNGCNQQYLFFHQAPRTYVKTDPANSSSTLVVPNADWGCSLQILLKKQNNNYYVKFLTQSAISATEFNYAAAPPICEFRTGSPPNQKKYNFPAASHSVNENQLSACVGIVTFASFLLISDTLLNFPANTYSSANSSTINFTFTPNP